MEKRIAIPAFCVLLAIGCALFLFGCVSGGEVSAPEAAAQADTPVVLSIGAAAADDAAQPAPTPHTTPIPVGKVEYRPDDGAHYEILPDATVRVTGGYVEIAIDGMAFNNPVQAAEGGCVRLTLTNGASLTGALTGETMLDFSVSLDAGSTWSLNGDASVDALVNGDAGFGNVSSNGHTISYNCECAENAYLGRASLPLPGGGALRPVI